MLDKKTYSDDVNFLLITLLFSNPSGLGPGVCLEMVACGTNTGGSLKNLLR